MTKKLQIRYWDDQENLLGTHTTDDDYTTDEIKAWEKWLNDNAVEAPNAPKGWKQFDLAPAGAQIATVQHYQDGGVGGKRQTIPYTGLGSVIAWSKGQAGHPWDGVLVNVYDRADYGERHALETYQVNIHDGDYEIV